MYKKASLSLIITFLLMGILVLMSYKNNQLFLNQILISCGIISLILFIKTIGNDT